VDALPIIRRTISQGTTSKSVAFPVLFQSQAQNLVSASKALTDSYEIVQRASSSAAANAVSQLAARFAAGTGELAQLVRSDQDLTGEAERLDKLVVAFVSKPPAERSATAEDEIRRRIEAVKAERDRLHQIFGQRFPDYVALSKPQPVSLQETQRLLADEEALLVFDLGAKSYAWIITRTEADWTELKVSGRGLDAQVRALRSSLTDARQRFDPELAYKIYQATFGVFADKIASKKRLSIVTNGALTSLPPQLLVTKDPTGKKLKEVDWLVRSHAITILPSVASLKALRQFAKKSIVTKSYVAFGNPLVLGPDGTDTGAWDRQQCPKDAPAAAQRVAHASTQLRDISSFFRGNLADVAEVQKLAALPETTDELCAVARRLDVPESEIWLGKRATERNIKEMSKQGRLASYRIVHFATHGLIAGELKGLAEPALVLTPPAEANDTDDGLLTASEVAQLKLNADWVVLSACNTAAAGPQGAEALSGLARAFFYAGARALLVSHWPVNSDAAVRLTTKAFAELRANPKIGRAEAMRRSMLDVITRGTDQEVHPAYWAPFVVVGEGGG